MIVKQRNRNTLQGSPFEKVFGDCVFKIPVEDTEIAWKLAQDVRSWLPHLCILQDRNNKQIKFASILEKGRNGKVGAVYKSFMPDVGDDDNDRITKVATTFRIVAVDQTKKKISLEFSKFFTCSTTEGKVSLKITSPDVGNSGRVVIRQPFYDLTQNQRDMDCLVSVLIPILLPFLCCAEQKALELSNDVYAYQATAFNKYFRFIPMAQPVN